MIYPRTGLNTRIEILVPTDTPDGGGGKIRSFGPASPPIKLWAETLGSRKVEETDADALGGRIRQTFKIWNRAGIDLSMKIRAGGIDYEIVAMAPDDSGLFLELEAVAKRLR